MSSSYKFNSGYLDYSALQISSREPHDQMKLGNMRETRTRRQKLGIRVRQIFKKLKSRDIKRYQPINIFSNLTSLVMISKNSLLCHSLFFAGN